MEFSADEKEGIIIRQIAELKDAVSKLNANHYSLLEMFQQDKHIDKDLQEKFDLLSENIDDVKTTVCNIGKRVEDNEKNVNQGFDALRTEMDKRVCEFVDRLTLMTEETARFETTVDTRIDKCVDTFHSGMKSVAKEIECFKNETNNRVDRIADSFGTLLSKSNQALDCIETIQDRLNLVETELLESKLNLEIVNERLNKLKRKQKKKNKNITLMIK